MSHHPGVTVAICCYNSAARLPDTLAHLAAQQSADAIDWEVLVVDNASTDETANVARASWPAGGRVPLRVVSEPLAGLSHARERARLEARYEYISFIDDDNWVSPRWVATVKAVLDANPGAGLAGGPSEAVCEVVPPSWFERVKHFYAVGEQAASRGSMPSFYLWGAGMCIRKGAWDDLRAAGFSHQLLDRSGTTLMSGGDSELSTAMRLAGWEQRYEPDLCLRHFIPRRRLQWSYVRSIMRGVGIGSVLLLPYDVALRGEPLTVAARVRQSWPWLMQAALRDLAVHWRAARPSRLAIEGNDETLRAEWRIGRLIGLLRHGSRYRRVRAIVRHAAWRRPMAASRPNS